MNSVDLTIKNNNNVIKTTADYQREYYYDSKEIKIDVRRKYD